jgi:high-affinity nickel permease
MSVQTYLANLSIPMMKKFHKLVDVSWMVRFIGFLFDLKFGVSGKEENQTSSSSVGILYT